MTLAPDSAVELKGLGMKLMRLIVVFEVVADDGNVAEELWDLGAQIAICDALDSKRAPVQSLGFGGAALIGPKDGNMSKGHSHVQAVGRVGCLVNVERPCEELIGTFVVAALPFDGAEFPVADSHPAVAGAIPCDISFKRIGHHRISNMIIAEPPVEAAECSQSIHVSIAVAVTAGQFEGLAEVRPGTGMPAQP